MLELLLLFSFWPWALFVALMMCLTFGAKFESPSFAAISVAAYSAVSWLVFDVNPFAWIATNPGGFVLLAFVYVSIGIGWSLFKWRNHLLSGRVQGLIKSGKTKHRDNPSDGSSYSDFRDSPYFPSDATPEANKLRIVNWISLWPFSAFVYVCNDLLAQFFNAIYGFVAEIYERMTSRYTS